MSLPDRFSCFKLQEVDLTADAKAAQLFSVREHHCSLGEIMTHLIITHTHTHTHTPLPTQHTPLPTQHTLLDLYYTHTPLPTQHTHTPTTNQHTNSTRRKT